MPRDVQRMSARDAQMPAGISLGALAVGAFALGALAIGFLAINRLAVKQARVKRLEIDELVISRMHRLPPASRAPGNSTTS